MSDVPLGAFLSGGIDSCSILGMASGAQQSPVKAFTIAFDHDEYDEASNLTARSTGLTVYNAASEEASTGG